MDAEINKTATAIIWGIVQDAVKKFTDNGTGIVAATELMYINFLRFTAHQIRTVYHYNYANKADANTVLIKFNGAWLIFPLNTPEVQYAEMTAINMIDYVARKAFLVYAQAPIPGFSDIVTCFNDMTTSRKIELLRTHET